jgi:hypothetical protein
METLLERPGETTGTCGRARADYGAPAGEVRRDYLQLLECQSRLWRSYRRGQGRLLTAVGGLEKAMDTLQEGPARLMAAVRGLEEAMETPQGRSG